ncbi:MAG: elongation factor Ts [Deltaproteobacteria bacterium]|nr:elongation factor Ts [Deltaproteobacteria bacterium]
MTITAAQVKTLREATGVGMMECKKALEDANGDQGKATKILRERGLAKAAKKSGRSAAEGVVSFRISRNGKEAAMIEINCETDFAGKNETFRKLADELAQLVLEAKAMNAQTIQDRKLPSGHTVKEALQNLVSTIGENIQLRRVSYLNAADGFIVGYNHMQGKIGSLILFSGQEDEKARDLGGDLAMHVAASAPRFFDREEVSAGELEEEKEIIKKRLAAEGKPENMIEKIAMGQVNKFYSETCFLDQPFVKEPKLSVKQHIERSGASARPRKFVRFQLGEGVEVSKGKFQQEVAELAR